MRNAVVFWKGMKNLCDSFLPRLLLAQPQRALFEQHAVALGQILRRFNTQNQI